MKFSEKKCNGPTPGEEQLYAPGHMEGQPADEQFCGERPEGSAGS